MSIFKSYTSRTAKGKSYVFLFLILTGYIAGIISKIASDSITYVLVFYILNAVMVSADLVLYFRNRKIDKISDQT